MAGKIVLVTGGARSGKSVFAEQYVSAAGVTVAYIATAQIYDDEMKRRVALHRRRRPENWQTFEAPYDADQAMLQAIDQAEAVLFDCLTLYTSNLLLAPDAPMSAEERYQYVTGKIDKLIDSACAGNATIVFVTNEVGMGIVPEHALAREYRDIAGLVNQKMAAVAAEVYLVVSGLAVDVKKLAVNIGKEA